MINLALGKDGFLLPRKKRLEIQSLLEQERSLLVDLIASGEYTDWDRKRFITVDAQTEQLIRINESEFDVARFAVEYFSDDINPDNEDNLLPSGVNYDTMSDFHKELCGLLSDVSDTTEKTNVAWACPRQHAKTAYGSNIYPIHQVVYKHRQFIVIVSETTEMAGAFITWGNRQLKMNEKLIQDFGKTMHSKASQNDRDNQEAYITLNGVQVMARGAGKQIRGMRYGKLRPQLLILDDLEGQEHISTSDQMAKIEKWFNEEVLPAMDKKGVCLYLGTILCYDSLLDKVVRTRGDFTSRRYKAVVNFPTNENLWSEWRKIYTSDIANSPQLAKDFYKENEEAMLEGVELLWGDYWTYYEFAEILINVGAKSFNQEYQNEPTDEERQIFKPEKFFYFDADEIAMLSPTQIEYHAGVDFAMGKEKGDFSTIATIMKNKDTGRMYVVEVYEGRLHPKEFMERIIEYTMKYQYDSIAVESQMAQEFFTDYLMEGLSLKGYPASSRVKKIKQRTRKALRIEALQPEIENGKIRFNIKHTNVINQFSMYPMAKHDDIIDAIEMGYRSAQSHNVGIVRTVRTKAKGRYG